MKKFFRKLASYCVTVYANRRFRKAMKVANSWYEHTKKRYYVITDPGDDSRLVALTSKDFFKIRRDMGIPSKQLPLALLKKRCWYYTPNENGRDLIPARELVIRRLAFVKDRLEAAGLLGK